MIAVRATLAVLVLVLGGASPLASTASAEEEALAAAPARELYRLHCSGCHGADGRGVPGTTPDLHALGAVVAAPGGREYLVRVPGVAQAPVENRALAGLLGWVLREFSGTAVEPPYTGDEVGALRQRPLRDPLAARPTGHPQDSR